jgi:hypothetical protein
MYWWNASKLAEDLQEGRVDERERFKYFLATFIGWALVTHLFVYYAGSFEFLRLVPLALSVAAGGLGIYLCYKANKAGDNKDFIGRMICLGWPCAFRTIAIGVVMFAIVLVGTSAVDRKTTISEAVGGFLRSSWWIVISGYFGMVQLYVGYFSHPKGTEKALLGKRIVRSLERAFVKFLGVCMGGAAAWAIIVRSGLPGFLKGLLGLALCVGFGWVVLRWVRMNQADLNAENAVFGVGVKSDGPETKTGGDGNNPSVG